MTLFYQGDLAQQKGRQSHIARTTVLIIKAVPGRKTDVKDSEWIADLLRHGLLNGSFIPKRELKETVRYRRSMVQERARELNRIQKVLEGVVFLSLVTPG